MILPSLGKAPGATSATSPRSLVSAWSVAATAAVSASLGLARLGGERHGVLLALAPDGEAQRAELRMALADLGDLARVDEQAPDLGRLIGAPHPTFQAAGRGPGREIAGGEAQQRIVAR